jgi:hypothetical protein
MSKKILTMAKTGGQFLLGCSMVALVASLGWALIVGL